MLLDLWSIEKPLQLRECFIPKKLLHVELEVLKLPLNDEVLELAFASHRLDQDVDG